MLSVNEKAKRIEENIKVSDNIANQITEFKLGYVWGQPITYVQRGNKDLRSSTDSQNEIQDDGISMLNELNDSEYAFSKDQELGRYVEINGIGYQFVDIKKNYNGLAPFDLVTLNPLFTFCIYRNSALQEKLAGVTFRRTENGDVYYTVSAVWLCMTTIKLELRENLPTMIILELERGFPEIRILKELLLYAH